MFCITKAHLYPKDNLWKTSKCKTNQQSYCKETKEDLLENKLVTPSDFRMKKGKKKHTVLLLLSCSNITAIKPDFHFLIKDKLAIKRRKEKIYSSMKRKK